MSEALRYRLTISQNGERREWAHHYAPELAPKAGSFIDIPSAGTWRVEAIWPAESYLAAAR